MSEPNNNIHKADGAIFDSQCAKCEHVLDCQGKPQEVKDCINFKERVKKRGNIQNH